MWGVKIEKLQGSRAPRAQIFCFDINVYCLWPPLPPTEKRQRFNPKWLIELRMLSGGGAQS